MARRALGGKCGGRSADSPGVGAARRGLPPLNRAASAAPANPSRDQERKSRRLGAKGLKLEETVVDDEET